MSDELMPWHKTWLVGIDYNRVDLVKEGANSQAQIKLFKSKGGTTMDLQAILKAMKPEHAAIVQKALDDAATAVTAAETRAAEAIEKSKSAEPAPGMSPEEILKSVKDPAVKALLEQSIAKTAAAEAAAQVLVEKALNTEAIAKAKDVANIGATEDQLSSIYKKLNAVDPALCGDVFGIFKSASSLVAAGGVLTEIGKSTPDDEGVSVGEEEAAAGISQDEATAWAAIEKAAAEIAKSGLSKSESIKKAIKDNPKLYEAYYNAQRK